MNKIKIVNLKCGGCKKTIAKSLEKAGITQIMINENTGEVSFEGDKTKARKILEKLGYPEVGSKKARSILKKAKSYLSCARGKVNLKNKNISDEKN